MKAGKSVSTLAEAKKLNWGVQTAHHRGRPAEEASA